jgi:hypothetical protein
MAGQDDSYLPQHVTFIDRLESGWTEPALMLDYGAKHVQRIDVGLWDYDTDGFAEEVLAVSTSEYPSIYLMDIWGCLDEPNWCLVDTIEGSHGALKSIDGNPVLLFEHEGSSVTGPAILEYELDTGSVRTVIDVITGGNERISGVDGAD